MSCPMLHDNFTSCERSKFDIGGAVDLTAVKMFVPAILLVFVDEKNPEYVGVGL